MPSRCQSSVSRAAPRPVGSVTLITSPRRRPPQRHRGARKAAPAAQPVAQPAQPAPAPAEAASSAQGHRRLLAFVGNSGEAIDILSSQQALLGKHRDCDIVCRAFPSPDNDSITHGVSRQHARLLVVSGKLLIEDLRSLNGTFPSSLLVWKEFAVGDPAIAIVPPSADSAVRWGSIRVHGENQDLWWYGPQAVLWQRSGRSISGAQAILPGDRLTLGATTIEWDEGQKPGLT